MIGIKDLNKNRLIAILGLSLFMGFVIVFSTDFLSSSSYYYFRYAFFFVLSVLIIKEIQKDNLYYLPSFYLFCFFTIIPLFGIPGYLFSYRKMFPSYLGVDLDMWRSLDLWLQGFFFVMLGIYISHLLRKCRSRKRRDSRINRSFTTWNWKASNMMLLVLIGISLACTILVVSKLGNIPILSGDIDRTRMFFADQVGTWIFRLSRLWIVIYFLGFIKLLKKIELENGFYPQKNIYLMGLLIWCLLLEGLYGDRFPQFIMVMFSIIMINKAVGKIKSKYILTILLIGIIAGNIVSIARNKSYRDMNASYPQKILLHTFGEFNVFAYTVQEYHNKNEYMRFDGFISAIAMMIPEQLWKILNIDKEEMRRGKSPAAVLGKIYKHYYGMRAGIAGEGFIMFGYLGLILVSLVAGILFGVLENVFISIRIYDVKEIVIAFAISIMMFLPLSQIDGLTGTFAYYIYAILVCILILRKKVPLEMPEEI